MTDLLAAVRQLQERLKAATPGPWLADPTVPPEKYGHESAVVAAREYDGRDMVADTYTVEDAELIVAAVNLVGPLIADWERLRERVDELEDERKLGPQPFRCPNEECSVQTLGSAYKKCPRCGATLALPGEQE